MRLCALRGHFALGRIIAPGECYELDDRAARELIATGKAILDTGTRPRIKRVEKPEKPEKPESAAEVKADG